MAQKAPFTPKGWGKIKAIAEYAGMSESTVEKWARDGLKYSQMPTGTRLFRYEWVDEYLERFSEKQNLAEKISEEMFAELQ